MQIGEPDHGPPGTRDGRISRSCVLILMSEYGPPQQGGTILGGARGASWPGQGPFPSQPGAVAGSRPGSPAISRTIASHSAAQSSTLS